MKIQSSVKTFLPGFGNMLLRYCAIVHFWGGQQNILRVILETYQKCFTQLCTRSFWAAESLRREAAFKRMKERQAFNHASEGTTKRGRTKNKKRRRKEGRGSSNERVRERTDRDWVIISRRGGAAGGRFGDYMCLQISPICPT